MNKKLKGYCLIGFIFVAVLGSLAHFFYEWSGNNGIVGLFTPVNESTWEHIKLLYFPMVIYCLFLWSRFKTDGGTSADATDTGSLCLSSAIPAGILWGCLLIPVLFYTYSGILGYHVTFVDIAIFIISTAAAFIAVYKLSVSCRFQKIRGLLLFSTFVLGILFLVFTKFPPDLGLFRVP